MTASAEVGPVWALTGAAGKNGLASCFRAAAESELAMPALSDGWHVPELALQSLKSAARAGELGP